MSVRCLEDSYALLDSSACMSSELKCDARGSILEVKTIRPWSGEAESREIKAWLST